MNCMQPVIVIAACLNLAILNVFSLYAKINYESISSWKHSLLCDSATSFWMLLLIQKIKLLIGNTRLIWGQITYLSVFQNWEMIKWLRQIIKAWRSYSKWIDYGTCYAFCCFSNRKSYSVKHILWTIWRSKSNLSELIKSRPIHWPSQCLLAKMAVVYVVTAWKF